MRKSLFTALLLALAVPFTALKAQAQFTLMPYVGYNTAAGVDPEGNDLNDSAGGFLVGIGAEFAVPFDAPIALAFQPSVETVFLPGEEEDGIEVSQSYYQVNANVVTEFTGSPTFTPYAGAGLAYGILAFEQSGGGFDSDESASGLGFNLLGGVNFNNAVAFGTPFVQARYTALEVEFEVQNISVDVDSGGLNVLAGLRIPLGQE